ncbi:DUF397 domain-containing protein [Thermomonospora catenispora]|uniref:DUF397 domain-containing protein n=1 Tax=Thermomonospora catenispora TaxID=2493090 RepID=UPI00111F65DC|nr:DUF397 domain-containing protein [Thermomonospora catenispora]TNY36972.1 DUF397 domain-containing protein [Thermomonospora catenispora]
MPEHLAAPWRKSTYSDGGGCVEVALAVAPGRNETERGTVHLVRDSKNPDLGTLRLTGQAWAALINDIKGQ